MPALRERLLRALSLRPGEWRRAMLVASLLFLTLCSYLLIKAIRNAAFIDSFGALKLPYVMLGVSVVVGAGTALYLRVSRGRDAVRLGSWLFGFFALNVLGFWALSFGAFSWVDPVFYLWSGLFGVFATTQVWALANEIFTTREARRLFGLLGAGGILGALAGGALSNLAPAMGSRHLLLLIAGLLFVTALLARSAGRYRLVRETGKAGPASSWSLLDSLREVRRRRHLTLLAALVFLTALTTTSIDFQFNLVAEQTVQGRDSLTQFLGSVYSFASVLGFLIQVFLTGWILNTLGLRFALLLLPGMLLGGTLALLWTPSLLAGLWLKTTDSSIKHSVDRAARELLYLPVPAELKRKTKFTIDTVMDRLGDGSAGLLQLVITAGLGLGLLASAAANLLLLGLWIPLAVLLRRSYAQELRASLGEGRRGSTLGSPLHADADTRRLLLDMLENPEGGAALGALELAARHPDLLDPDTLVTLAKSHRRPDVRRAALRALLGSRPGESLPDELSAALDPEDHELLVRLLDLMTAEDVGAQQALLDALPGQGAGEARAQALGILLRRLGPEFRPFATRLLDLLVRPEAPASFRRLAAELAGYLGDLPDAGDRVVALLEDPDRDTALAAVDSAGRLGTRRALPLLTRHLGHPDTRGAARRALARMGPDAAVYLSEALRDGSLAPAVRRAIPRVLADLATHGALDALMTALDDLDPAVREGARRALFRLRREAAIHRLVRAEEAHRRAASALARLRGLRRAAAVLEAHPTTGAGEGDLALLAASLRQRTDALVEEVLELLGLAYPAEDLERVRAALVSGDRIQKANALDFLQHHLAGAHGRRIVRALEESPPAVTVTGDADLRGILQELLQQPDPWLVACSVHIWRRRWPHQPPAALEQLVPPGSRAVQEEVDSWSRIRSAS